MSPFNSLQSWAQEADLFCLELSAFLGRTGIALLRCNSQQSPTVSLGEGNASCFVCRLFTGKEVLPVLHCHAEQAEQSLLELPAFPGDVLPFPGTGPAAGTSGSCMMLLPSLSPSPSSPGTALVPSADMGAATPVHMDPSDQVLAMRKAVKITRGCMHTNAYANLSHPSSSVPESLVSPDPNLLACLATSGESSWCHSLQSS